MKKTILAFGAGQALQLVILAVALHITYADNTMLFCIIGGVAATVILGTGVVLDRIELAVKENEMDETAPLPKEIKVTNDKIEKEPPAPPKTDSILFDRPITPSRTGKASDRKPSKSSM